jgi:oxygen-independent coproporphyrinogen III oxidase
MLEPYMGFGADAHSFDGRERWANADSVEAYLDTPLPHGRGSVSEALSDEKLFLGLRMSAGVRPTAEEWQRFAGPIRRFVEDGLLVTSDGALRLTERGVLLSNEVFQEFLTA